MAKKRNVWEAFVRRLYYKYFSQNILYELQIRARNEAVDYVQKNMNDAVIFESQKEIIEYAIKNCRQQGNYLEFGVATGRSINTIASFTPNGTKVYGFDTFEGLPEDWAGHNAVSGTFKQARLPKVLNNVVLIRGLFENTLPSFREQMPENISFCHIDCDLYSSTKTILETLGDKLTTGSYVLFDEYFNYPAWRQHEWKAWQEFCASNKVKYRYAGFLANGGTVLVEVL